MAKRKTDNQVQETTQVIVELSFISIKEMVKDKNLSEVHKDFLKKKYGNKKLLPLKEWEEILKKEKIDN